MVHVHLCQLPKHMHFFLYVYIVKNKKKLLEDFLEIQAFLYFWSTFLEKYVLAI